MEELKHLNTDNLRLAVEGIKKLPIDDRHFDISIFGALQGKSKERSNKILETCDTIACFLGWFPFVKGLEPVGSDFAGETFYYEFYCRRILGIPFTGIFKGNLWLFLFSPNWSVFDPTLYGALARAEHVLDGNYRDDWEYGDFREGWSLTAKNTGKRP